MQPCRLRGGLVALAILCIPPALAFAQDKADVKVVKYPELATTIKNLKGKVIVVDFWADW